MVKPVSQTTTFGRGTPTQLLAIQGFLAGFSLALLFAIANTRFLTDFSTAFFPHMYVVTAVAIPLVTVAYNYFSNRLPQSRFLLSVSFVIFIAYLTTWMIATFFLAPWISFALMVFFSIALIFQLIIISVQATQLFDLRQIKTQTPLVLASQTAALIVSGLSVTIFTRLLGGVTNLLLLCMILSGLQWVATWYTIRRFEDRFKTNKTSILTQARASWGEALSQPFARHIFLYRFFSAFGTEMVLILVAIVAERIFTNEEELASFFGNVMALGTFMTLLFLLLAASYLLKRFGLGFGILVNPVVVVAPIVVLLALTPFNIESGRFLLIVVLIARIADFILSVGTSEPSVKTMFQALPERTRPVLITIVESLGLPLTYAMVGVSLFVLRGLNIYNDLSLLIYTTVVCTLWTIFSYRTYRLYSGALLDKLSRRSIGAFDLDIADPGSASVISQLAFSSNPRQVRLALNLLEQAEHSDYAPTLMALVDNQSQEVRLDAISRLETRPSMAIKSRVGQISQENEPLPIRAAALKTYLASGDPKAVPVAVSALEEEAQEIKQAALVGLLKYGGLAGHVSAGQQLIQLADSDEPNDQLLLARTLADSGDHNFFQPIQPLLASESVEVRTEALHAAANVRHPSLIPSVIDQLQTPQIKSTAIDALTHFGTDVLPYLDRALQFHEYPIDLRNRLIRAAGNLPPKETAEVLAPHIGHRFKSIRESVRIALRRLDYQVDTSSQRDVVEVGLATDIEHAATLLSIEESLAESERFPTLLNGLRHEYKETVQQIFYLIGYLYDPRVIRRASDRIDFGTSSEIAEAIETLDVMLSSTHKRLVLPLIDPDLTPSRRLSALRGSVNFMSQPVEEWLPQLIENPGDRFDDYTTAAAIYDAANAADFDWQQPVSNAQYPPDSLAAETAQGVHPSGERQMLTIEKISILKETSVFATVPEGVLTSVAKIVDVIELPANEQFINEGDLADEMFIIVEGKVDVVKNGKTLIELKPGETVGELALFDPEPRSADVITSEQTVLLRLEQETLRDVMADRPEISDGVIRALTQRIRAQGKRMAE